MAAPPGPTAKSNLPQDPQIKSPDPFATFFFPAVYFVNKSVVRHQAKSGQPGPVVEGMAAALAGVSPDVSPVPAVPDDIATVRAGQAVGPPGRPDQPGCSRHIGKQCSGRSNTGPDSFRFCVLSRAMGARGGDLPTQISFGYACLVRGLAYSQHSADGRLSLALKPKSCPDLPPESIFL